MFFLLLDDLLTLLWAFNMSWVSCSRSRRCVGHVYPVGGGNSWFFPVSSSPCSTVSLYPSWLERIIIGFGNAHSCWKGMSSLDAPYCWDKWSSGWDAPPGLEGISSLGYLSYGYKCASGSNYFYSSDQFLPPVESVEQVHVEPSEHVFIPFVERYWWKVLHGWLPHQRNWGCVPLVEKISISPATMMMNQSLW